MKIWNFIKKLFNDKDYNATSSNNTANSLQILSDLLEIDKKSISNILKNIDRNYHEFSIRKRKGGIRIISAPNKELLSIQRKIYQEILEKGKINSSAKGFRKRMSISDNAKPHLNKVNILKVDIVDFFGTIKEDRIVSIFIDLGYDNKVSGLLAGLCCLDGKLPQGAPTSPVLSNIVAYKLDEKLNGLSYNNKLTYTRYADDLAFSGNFIKEGILSEINKIVESEGFKLNEKKTVYMSEKSRKIITGVSISSGKMTVPKVNKREIRKRVYFILTRGVEAHQEHIKSKDSLYLKRTLGYLYFWLSIEPDNQYVKNSIKSLKMLKK